ncbi:unnamed protein product [Owenia fusiformis]|uniref:Uncharacterized protein n=1 Tax=Owenia fusiformis TaxID=6347 RepID=A0A8J1TV11_OWEFU|nr:unnamed protein product [Owenia fusiformis]
MEFKSAVYNAAREGKVCRLKMFLDHKNEEEVKMLCHAKTNGGTPLIMGCRHGHIDVVEYLIDSCNVDIEQTGSVTFDGETIEGAPPLWSAAAAGHKHIVEFLISKGAGVNNTTFTNSTPLRAACFDGHIEIVKYLCEHNADIEVANRHGHTCLMISCYKGHIDIVKYLLERKADANRKSVKGNTALHDCAESGSLDIMKLLLERSTKMEKDSYGMTPLLAAAVTGHTNIVEYLTDSVHCDKAERIDALELLGATYVDKKRDMLGGLHYWRQAMEERFSDPIHLMPKPETLSKIAAYENATEVTNRLQLDELISDPDDMRMQALLVRERILGPAHPDTSYYIRYRGAVYADLGNFDRCITLWMYALDMQQKLLEPLNPMTQSSFLSFAELFSFMMSDNRSRPAQNVPFNDIMAVYEECINEIDRGSKHIQSVNITERDHTNYNRLILVVLHLMCLICKTKRSMRSEQDFSFKKLAYKLVKMNPLGTKGYSLLHMACAKETTSVGRYPVCAFPSIEVVNILLEVGANIHATDIDNNTPLHIAAMNKPSKVEVVKLLLNNGAHVDTCNNERQNPMQILRSASQAPLPISIVNYISLQCLAAQTIMQSKINYVGSVPKKMEDFLKMH